MSSLDQGEVAGNIPAFFGVGGGFGGPVMLNSYFTLTEL